MSALDTNADGALTPGSALARGCTPNKRLQVSPAPPRAAHAANSCVYVARACSADQVTLQEFREVLESPTQEQGDQEQQQQQEPDQEEEQGQEQGAADAELGQSEGDQDFEGI